MKLRNARDQMFRYATVGLVSNMLIYLAYIALTQFGVGYKTAMTFLYALAVVYTFVFNRSWSFGYEGALHGAFTRYVASYIVGYLLNFTVLWVAVDRLGAPHQIVQGLMIVVVAVMIFLLQKYWVFAGDVAIRKESA